MAKAVGVGGWALPSSETESEIAESKMKGKRCPLGKPEADLEMGRVAAPKPPSVRGSRLSELSLCGTQNPTPLVPTL